MKNNSDINVLVAEDDFLVCELVRGLLEDMDFNYVGRAKDGLTAVQMTIEKKPDVVLMDVNMPEMDGIEAARAILKKRPTPIVMLTAYEDPKLVHQAGQAGAGAYLVKPPSAREIERAIIVAMVRSEALTELRKKNEELQHALEKVKQLRGLLPICCSCRKIRNDEGYWQLLEDYFSEHSDLDFSHGFCPDCMEKLYPGLDD